MQYKNHATFPFYSYILCICSRNTYVLQGNSFISSTSSSIWANPGSGSIPCDLSSTSNDLIFILARSSSWRTCHRLVSQTGLSQQLFLKPLADGTVSPLNDLPRLWKCNHIYHYSCFLKSHHYTLDTSMIKN